MGERICIMKDGRVVQVGPPLEVYRNPANTFVAGFLASPPMNLLPARLEADAAGGVAATHGASCSGRYGQDLRCRMHWGERAYRARLGNSARHRSRAFTSRGSQLRELGVAYGSRFVQPGD